MLYFFFFFQAEDGIRDLVRSRGLGDVYKRQSQMRAVHGSQTLASVMREPTLVTSRQSGIESYNWVTHFDLCLLYTSDAADERSSVDLGGRRIIKKKKKQDINWGSH